MFRLPVFTLVALLAASCNQKEEVTAFEDLAPKADRNYDRDTVRTIDADTLNRRPGQSVFLSVIDTLFAETQWKRWDTTLFPDRFSPKFREKWMVITPKDSLILLNYEFKDSLKTKNAFFNYLDCFGSKCMSYTVGDNLRIPKRNGLILVGEKRLMIIESNTKINEMAVRESLQKDPEKESWLYIVIVPRSGRSVWKRIDKGEEKPVTKAYENS